MLQMLHNYTGRRLQASLLNELYIQEAKPLIVPQGCVSWGSQLRWTHCVWL